MHSNINVVVILWLHCPHPSLVNLNQGKGNDKNLYLSKTWVERTISKKKPLFALLIVESKTSEIVRHIHHLAEAFLKEF